MCVCWGRGCSAPTFKRIRLFPFATQVIALLSGCKLNLFRTLRRKREETSERHHRCSNMAPRLWKRVPALSFFFFRSSILAQENGEPLLFSVRNDFSGHLSNSPASTCCSAVALDFPSRTISVAQSPTPTCATISFSIGASGLAAWLLEGNAPSTLWQTHDSNCTLRVSKILIEELKH